MSLGQCQRVWLKDSSQEFNQLCQLPLLPQLCSFPNPWHTRARLPFCSWSTKDCGWVEAAHAGPKFGGGWGVWCGWAHTDIYIYIFTEREGGRERERERESVRKEQKKTYCFRWSRTFNNLLINVIVIVVDASMTYFYWHGVKKTSHKVRMSPKLFLKPLDMHSDCICSRPPVYCSTWSQFRGLTLSPTRRIGWGFNS